MGSNKKSKDSKPGVKGTSELLWAKWQRRSAANNRHDSTHRRVKDEDGDQWRVWPTRVFSSDGTSAIGRSACGDVLRWVLQMGKLTLSLSHFAHWAKTSLTIFHSTLWAEAKKWHKMLPRAHKSLIPCKLIVKNDISIHWQCYNYIQKTISMLGNYTEQIPLIKPIRQLCTLCNKINNKLQSYMNELFQKPLQLQHSN